MKNNTNPAYEPIMRSRPSVSFQYAAVPAYTSDIATAVGARVFKIDSSVIQLKDSIIQRGVQYVGNVVPSRGGYMAENFTAESYNLDAVLKNIDTPKAVVPGETGRASPDIIYSDGEASLKFYADARSSGKAQLNPEYENQTLIVPKDQVQGAKEAINKTAHRNELRGRTEIANEQRQVADKITDRIRDKNGVESTPLTKQQDLDMAKAVHKDADGNIVIEKEKLDQVLDETGISGRVRSAKLRSELTGLGLAAAIGLGTGIAISVISGLAQMGLNSEGVSDLMFSSLAAGMESGAIAAVTYAVGRGATQLIASAGVDLLSASGRLINFAAIGLVSTSVVCIYQFAKLMKNGSDVGEALKITGKTALSSTAMLAVSLIAQGIWGGPAGIIVSSVTGLALLVADTGKTIHARKLEERLREFSIQEYRKIIDITNSKEPIYIVN